jgi:hypothetical protein
MPNFKSDLITARDAISVSDKQVDGDRTSGLILYATALVTLSGSLATNDTIELVDIPPGAVVVPQLSHVTGGDPGTTLRLSVGDSAVAARYANAINLDAGGQVGFCSGTMPAAVTAPFRPTAPTRLVATVTSAATVTNGVVLAFTIAFRCKA